MPRVLLFPLTAMLVIATAIAMLASAVLLPMPDPAASSMRDGTEVVRQFYAAVNETIATGNPAALQRVVAPSFVDENPLPGLDPGRAGLEAYLVALHGSVPGLRLIAEIIGASADQIVTRVTVRDDHPPGGLPAFGERAAVWSAVEVVHVADGAVVARWGNTDGLTLARPLADERLPLPIPTLRVISLVRVTMQSGARWDAPPAGLRLLYLEDGVLEVRATPASDAPLRLMLVAERTWLAPTGGDISTTNVGVAAAHLLAVTFSEPQIPNGLAPEAVRLSRGVEVEILAGDMATRLGSGPVTVVLKELSLASHTDLSLSSIEGPILVVVETAQLDATVWGTAWVRNRTDGRGVAAHAAVLTPENGLLVQPGGVVALHTGERHPVQVLVVAIQTSGRVP